LRTWLRPGSHCDLPRERLALERQHDTDQAVHRIAITCDEDAMLVLEEPEEWDLGFGNEGGGDFAPSSQLAVNRRVVLFRRRFMRPAAAGQSMAPKGPTDGLLLWIQDVGEANSPR
jgi:hypothetical protein